MMEAIHPNVPVTPDQIAEFCQKWKITRFELFGSVLRDDFDADSDIDVLVTFAPGARVTLFSLIHMEDELKVLCSRDVDLVERKAIEESPNWIRRKSILSSTQLVYAAA